MYRKSKISLVCAVVAMVLAGCGQNAAEEPNQNLQPTENITGTAAAAQAGQFTDYGTSSVAGQAGNVGYSYGPCPNDPNQVCQQQMARSCSGSQGNIFGQQVSQCNANYGIQTQLVRVQVRRVFTRYVVANPTPTQNCTTGNCIDTGSGVQQIQYGDDRQCAFEKVVLGSVKFNVGTYPNTNNQFVTLTWNDYKGSDTPIQYYRVVIYGDQAMTPSMSWVSQKVFANPNSQKVATIIDANSQGAFENVSFGGLNLITSEQRALGTRVPWQRDASYWYKIIAFTADGQIARGSDNQELHRPFDIVLVDCTPTVIAGFCSFN